MDSLDCRFDCVGESDLDVLAREIRLVAAQSRHVDLKPRTVISPWSIRLIALATIAGFCGWTRTATCWSQ